MNSILRLITLLIMTITTSITCGGGSEIIYNENGETEITYNENTEHKHVKTDSKDFILFAQKYEACFGEKPSKQVWALEQRKCSTGRCVKSY